MSINEWFVAIEGSTCAGKSTAVIAVAQRLMAGVVPEHTDIEKVMRITDRGMPYFPPKCKDEAIIAITRMVELEMLRERLRNSFEQDIVLMDTSPVTVLAFEYAKMQLGFPAALRELAASYRRLLTSGDLKEPKAWAILEPPLEVILSRLGNRPANRVHPFLANPNALTIMRRFRADFWRNHIKSVPCILLDTFQLSQKTIEDTLSEFIPQARVITTQEKPLYQLVTMLCT